MKKNNTVFHMGSYIDAMKQMAALICVCIVALALMEYVVACAFAPDFEFVPVRIEQILFPVALVYIVVSPALVMYLFRYQYSRGGSDCYHALPIQRKRVFISYSAAILTVDVLFVMIGGILAEMCVYAANGGFDVRIDNSSYYIKIGWYVAASIYTMATMLLSLSISGTRFMSLCFYALLFLPLLKMMSVWREKNVYGLLYPLLFGVLFWAIACVLDEKRPSETAGHSVAPGTSYVVMAGLLFAAAYVWIVQRS